MAVGKKTQTFVALAVVAFGVFLGRNIQSARTTRRAEMAVIKKEIQEHLPLGSSRSDVDTFLDGRGIGHTYIGKLDASTENSHTETALIRGTSHSPLVRGDIQILFKFDATDSKLVSYTVREIFTGP